MAATRSAVLDRFPHLRSVTDGERWDAAILDAEAILGPTAFGAAHDRAAVCYVAHLIESRHPELAVTQGVVASESIGGVSRTYAVSGGAAAGGRGPFSMTAGGRAYLELLRAETAARGGGFMVA